MPNEGPAVHFLNIEYFFRLFYALFHGGTGTANFHTDSLFAFLSRLWLLVTVISYLFSLACIGLLVYATMRVYQIRKEEEKRYSTKTPQEVHEQVEHSRWDYITQLIKSGQEAEWRQAIIESDIMLDELLSRLGYEGDSLGEKLRSVNAAQFQTLNNAWEAHRVRNEIAHQGSAYELSDSLAQRTIANYESVFREHGEI